VLGGTGVGIAYATSTGSPSVSGMLSGVMTTSVADPYLDDIGSVFGVTQRELLGMADAVVTNVSDLPPVLPSMTLTVIKANATFTPAQPLVGTGILVVLGDLTLQQNSLSNFNGLIYTTGDYEQNSPSQISGAIVSRGDVAIRGSGDFSEVNYDGSLLTQMVQQMGQYRFSRSALLIDQ